MLGTQLEQLFRTALREQGHELDGQRDASVRFAARFAGLLIRIVPADSPPDAMRSVAATLSARTKLDDDEIQTLIELAMRPEVRTPVDDDAIRAFGGRFGDAAEQALREASTQEVDLHGFTDEYGPSEALLLLDALFAVCAVDHVIDQTEIGRLQDAADQLGIDAMLVGALFRKHDMRHAAGDFRFELTQPAYVIGRSPAADIRLPDPLIGRQHCRLVRDGVAWRVIDIDSGRPTLLDGQPVRSSPFRHPSRLRIGSYTLELTPDENTLLAFGSESFSSLSVRHLHRKIGTVTLLDDVDFTVFSGEVVAVIGPSGSGKTTLLHAITGIAPADEGSVILDGRNFHDLLEADRSLVGIVPQEDILHADLTVEETLRYAARLRFPPSTTREELDGEVNRVLRELDIERIRETRVGDAVRRGVSGGQRKRVNLGQELLTRSTRVLFLDEPTSGLDPKTGQEIVGLVRQLADDGRIAFLVTHDITSALLEQVDHVLVLAPGGRLAWFGPPAEAREAFGVKNADQIFAVLAGQAPEQWAEIYKESRAARTYVRAREHLLGLDGVTVDGTRTRPHRGRFWSQLRTLTGRYAKTKWRDRSGTLILLAQAPILALAMWAVFPAADVNSLFMLALSSLWFGASASVRELIAERAIWRRESRVGLRTSAYLGSKLVVLGLLTGLQCSLLAGLNYLLLDMGNLGFSAGGLVGVSVVTGWTGMSLGLAVSSMFASSEAAVGSLPLLLIPQITFGGLIVKVKEMGAAAKLISSLMIVRYSFDGLIKTGERLTVPGTRGMERDFDGRDILGPLWELGFRTSTEPDDLGVPLPSLLAVLAAFSLLLLIVTYWNTARSREGN